MKTVQVNASTKSYNVYIGSGLLYELGQRLRGLLPKAEKIAIISDGNVYPLYGSRVEDSLRKAGFETVSFVLPAGEQSKCGGSFLALLSFLAESGLSRTDAVAALGGGMVGDIAGFTAASYQRGLGYVQLPTSLLAMVDSSVGGKTAIDLPEGKNLAGAFHQPEAVFCDTDTLSSLPEKVFRDGCAEVLKYGVLGDGEIFRSLSENGLAFDREEIIFRSVSMKRRFVCADEFDKGERRMLNLGHSFGHALEKLSAFTLSHGESVAVGMAVAARAGAKSGFCGEDCPRGIEAVLEKLGLPTKCSVTLDEAMPYMLSDKKREGSRVNIIVPEKIGLCRIVPMSAGELKEFMQKGL